MVRDRYETEKTIVMDLDGTLTNGEYPYVNATPRQDMIDKVNSLYDAGWRVIVFTARGMNRFKDMKNGGHTSFEMDFGTGEPKEPVRAAVEEYGKLTYHWLIAHGVKFHHLRFGKPAAIYYVDDKSLTPEAFLEREI